MCSVEWADSENKQNNNFSITRCYCQHWKSGNIYLIWIPPFVLHNTLINSTHNASLFSLFFSVMQYQQYFSYIMVVIWRMRSEGQIPSLYVYWLKGSLTSHTIWYKRNCLLITLSGIHRGEMDCSIAECYSLDQHSNPVPSLTNPAL